jgi:hypothetical protein
MTPMWQICADHFRSALIRSISVIRVPIQPAFRQIFSEISRELPTYSKPARQFAQLRRAHRVCRILSPAADRNPFLDAGCER